MTETPEMMEEDIAKDVLENICNMNGVEKNIQAQNIFRIHGDKTVVRISNKGITLHLKRKISCIKLKNKLVFVPYSDVVSVRSSLSSGSERQNNSSGYGTFRNYMRRGSSSSGDGRRLIFVGTMPDMITINYVKHDHVTGIMKLKKVELTHSDSEVISWWSTTITSLVNPANNRPKNLLVFINPFGGHGTAKQIWENKVAPVFSVAGIACKVIVTESSDHAETVIQSSTLDNYQGIISVGGDGMFSQIFNGLLVRTARDNKLDVNERTSRLLQPGLRVGFIPAGSTDSVAMCLHGTADPVTAALHIVLGDRRDVDVSAVHTEAGLERFVMTMSSYGYFGDLLKYSEGLRCLGRYRYDLCGVRTFLRHKSYGGTISYVPSGVADSALLTDSCGEGCPQCSFSQSQLDWTPEEHPDHQNLTTVNGKFLAILACNTSCTDRHAVKGMDPAAHTGDGFQDIIMVKKVSYLGFLRYLIRSAYQTSSPFTLPYVTAVRVKQWEFSPDGDKPSEFSSWNCDGELVENPKIFVKTYKQLVPVFARGIYNPLYKEIESATETSDDFMSI